MAQIDWNDVARQVNGGARHRSKWSGCNVKFLVVTRKNEEKSAKAGREIYDEVPSVSFQWPGQDETVRALEERDKLEHPELWAAFSAGTGPIESGMPLTEWPKISASAIRELHYLGFRTVEQLAEANDDVKRRMGPLVQFVKAAKEWLDAASSDQAQVVALKSVVERERLRADRLENQVELLLQRIEANEGTQFTRPKTPVVEEIDPELVSTPDEELEAVQQPVKRPGRPHKIV